MESWPGRHPVPPGSPGCGAGEQLPLGTRAFTLATVGGAGRPPGSSFPGVPPFKTWPPWSERRRSGWAPPPCTSLLMVLGPRSQLPGQSWTPGPARLMDEGSLEGPLHLQGVATPGPSQQLWALFAGQFILWILVKNLGFWVSWRRGSRCSAWPGRGCGVGRGYPFSRVAESYCDGYPPYTDTDTDRSTHEHTHTCTHTHKHTHA